MTLLHKPSSDSDTDSRVASFLRPATSCDIVSEDQQAPPVSAIPEHVHHQLALEASGKFKSTPGYHAQRFTPEQWQHHRKLRASLALNQVPR